MVDALFENVKTMARLVKTVNIAKTFNAIANEGCVSQLKSVTKRNINVEMVLIVEWTEVVLRIILAT